MNKKSRRKSIQPATRQFPWLWLAVACALLLVVGGLAVWALPRPDSTVAPEAGGAPRLAVDQTTVDEGYVQFNQTVRTTFRLSNVGDEPLEILGEPQVELVEGC